MERLTPDNLKTVCYDTWELCGIDHECKRDCCKPTPCKIPKIIYLLGQYEDTGLTPDEIPHWIPASERLPEAEKPVLICATRKFCDGKEAQIRSLAMYEDGKTVTENSGFDWNNEDFEYDEKSDSFVIPEGWWEYPVYSESFSAVDDFVTHWMPLPQPPKEEK